MSEDSYSIGQPDQQPIPVTPENISAAYKSMFGTEAPQDFIDSVSKNYGSSYNNMGQVVGDMATSAANSGTPFANKPGDQGGFTGGAQYYQSQGYVPGSSSLEGVPTSFVDPKTGKVVASYGEVIQNGSAPGTSSNSGNWTWNDVSKTPEGYSTSLARAKTDTHSFQDFLKAGAIAAAVAASAGALAPEALGAAGALEGVGAGAGAGAGALGVAGGDIGAFTAADALASTAGQGAFDMADSLGMTLDQAVNTGLISSTGDLTAAGGQALMGMSGEMGAASAGAGGAGATGVGGLTDAQATALMGNNLLPADMQIPASQGLTATEAMRYANLAKSALSSLGGGTGSGTGAGGTGGAGAAGGAGMTAPLLAGAGTFTTGLHQQTPATAGTEKLNMLFPELDPALARQLAMSGNTGSNLGGNYFAYGSPPTNLLSTPLSNVATQPNSPAPMQAKDGGGVLQSFRDGGALHVPEFITGATGHYVKGRGDGQSDDIPAMLADGEYVFDADTVAQLGNGSSDAGAKVLDKMREALRHHKRSAPVDSIPPKAKSPLEYIKLGMKRK